MLFSVARGCVEVLLQRTVGAVHRGDVAHHHRGRSRPAATCRDPNSTLAMHGNGQYSQREPRHRFTGCCAPRQRCEPLIPALCEPIMCQLDPVGKQLRAIVQIFLPELKQQQVSASGSLPLNSHCSKGSAIGGTEDARKICRFHLPPLK